MKISAECPPLSQLKILGHLSVATGIASYASWLKSPASLRSVSTSPSGRLSQRWPTFTNASSEVLTTVATTALFRVLRTASTALNGDIEPVSIRSNRRWITPLQPNPNSCAISPSLVVSYRRTMHLPPSVSHNAFRSRPASRHPPLTDPARRPPEVSSRRAPGRRYEDP